MMLEFSFWKTSPPQTTNGIYELRKYNLKVLGCRSMYEIYAQKLTSSVAWQLA